MFLTISYHEFIIAACSVRLNVHGEDAELHRGIGSLDKPRAVSLVTVAVRPARGEEKDWQLARPQEPTASTCRRTGDVFETSGWQRKEHSRFKCQSRDETNQPIKTIFSKKSLTILLNPLIKTAVMNII